MKAKVVFNGIITEKSLDKIQEHINTNGTFSGSIDIKKLNLNISDPSFSYYFSNVNSSEFDYYLNIFKKETTNLNNKEVTFDIQTDAITTITI